MHQLLNHTLKFILILVGSFFCFTQATYCQLSKIHELKNWELLGFGKDAEQKNDLYSAIDYYSAYLERKPRNMNYSYRLAKLYFDVHDFEKSKALFNKVIDKSQKKYPVSLYYLGEILRVESNYDSAITIYEQFKKSLYKSKFTNIFYFLTDIKIKSCDFAAQNSYVNANFQIRHLNTTINKAHMESAPLIINDSVFVYSSLIADSIPLFSDTSRSTKPHHRFYGAKLINKQWLGNQSVSGPFDEMDSLNTSNGTFSEDMKRFYFTITRTNDQNRPISSIYLRHFKNDTWSKPLKLDDNINLQDYTSTQAALCNYSEDYEIMYFVSDRPGGWGGLDIWYAVYNKKTGQFNKPVNAGGYLNSAGDDITPFYDSETKTMYYSSDGFPGYGGFDIFRSNGSLVEWLPPENLGLPINSNYNDIYFEKRKSKEGGFLVSNRNGSIDLKNPNCCYDIFEFIAPKKLKIKVAGNVAEAKITTMDDIYNKTSIIPKPENVKVGSLADKMIQLWMLSPVPGISVLIKTEKIDSLGQFDFGNVEVNRKYLVKIDDKSLLKKEIFFNTEKIEKDTLIMLDSIFIELMTDKPIVFQQIYFEFGSAQLTKESEITIKNTILKIMELHPEIIVEIGAHTDYMGRKENNLKLSQKRAETVVNYLITNGISSVRLKPVGYGEEFPLYPSKAPNGKDIPEAREKNRRIEFKIIGSIHKQ
jgi:OmpA-OmpF porin, OOP family